MRNLNLVFSLLLLTVVALACNLAAPAFKEFKSDAGKFSVEAPGEMKEASQDIPSAAGTIKLTTYTATAGNKAFIVSYNDYPAAVTSAAPQTLLDGAQSGAIAQVNGTLVNDKNINLSGNPGKEYVANVKTPQGDAVAKARIYLVKTRLYQTLAIVPKNEADSPDAIKFLDSFKLTGN